jgi:hypothetical protein
LVFNVRWKNINSLYLTWVQTIESQTSGQQIKENQMLEDKNNLKICKGNSKESGRWMAISAGIGVALGAGIGTAFGNIPIGVGVGVAIGSAIGMLLKQAKKNNEDS